MTPASTMPMITATDAMSAGLPLVALTASLMPLRSAKELGRNANAAIVHRTAEITAEM